MDPKPEGSILPSTEEKEIISPIEKEKPESNTVGALKIVSENQEENRTANLKEVPLLVTPFSPGGVSLSSDKLEPLPGIIWPDKKRKLRFGFLTGFNFSNGKPGLTFGLSIERRLLPQWSVELAVSYRGSHIDHWGIDSMDLTPSVGRPPSPNFAIGGTPVAITRLKYTDFPLMIKWRPKQRFTLYGGPKLGLLSSAYGRVILLNTFVDQGTESNHAIDLYQTGFLRRVEWGAVLGAVVHLDENIGLGLRGHFGLTRFSDPDILMPSPQKRNLDLQFLVQLHF